MEKRKVTGLALGLVLIFSPLLSGQDKKADKLLGVETFEAKE